MKKKCFVKYIVLWATLLMGAESCSVDVPSPDLYSDPDAIVSVESARSLLTSCYQLYPHYEFELSQMGNDFCLTNLSGKNSNQKNLYLWLDKQISSFAADAWLGYYNCIANCDVLLERMDKVNATTDVESRQKAVIGAEAKTLKAMAYFDVLRLFASSYNDTSDSLGIVIKNFVGLEEPERASKKKCVSYILQLLNEAIEVGSSPSQNGWLSANAARSLRAEVELYAGDYARALDDAKSLLKDCPDDGLMASGVERFWVQESWNGRIFAFNTNASYYADIQYSAEEGDFYAVNPQLLLDESDARRKYAEYTKMMAGENRRLLGKYNRMNKENLSIAYINRMRYAGALFIAAECQARLGRFDEAVATVNRYLGQMNSGLIDSSLTGESLIQAILEAKWKEFVGEGQNYFDLKRVRPDSFERPGVWGKGSQGSIADNDYRWTFPIPASEYKYNNNMKQNQGWPINR